MSVESGGNDMAEIDQFIAVSKALTGFDALDANLAAAYLQRLKTVYGAGLTALLDAASQVNNGDYAPIIANPTLRPLAAQVVAVWFTGEFAGLPTTDNQGKPKNGKPNTPTRDQFNSGLLWDVIRAHPPAHSTQDYGYWTKPPQV
jgi:hypothetical protein